MGPPTTLSEATLMHSAGPGNGREFVVRLPPADPARIATEAREPESAPAPGSDRLRILLVDDNADALEIMAEALREAGHEVAVADDGLEALRLLDTLDPGVGVLDLGMPVMDGLELARRIRERRPAGKPLLIAVSGYSEPRDRVLSREAGFDLHFAKQSTWTRCCAPSPAPPDVPGTKQP